MTYIEISCLLINSKNIILIKNLIDNLNYKVVIDYYIRNAYDKITCKKIEYGEEQEYYIISQDQVKSTLNLHCGIT